MRLDHIQLAMPAGAEEQARQFYRDLLQMEEVPKPPLLRGRGGCWFQSGDVELHLGVEEPFRPARKAHPGIALDDIEVAESLARELAAAGFDVSWDHATIPGRARFFTRDIFGNRLEFLVSV